MIWPIVLLLVVAIALLILGLKFTRHTEQSDRDQQNISIIRQELADLKTQRDNGELTEEAFQQAYDELVVTLGTDLESNEAKQARSGALFFDQTKTLIIVSVTLAVLAPMLYYNLGVPEAVNPVPVEMSDAHSSSGNQNLPSVDAMVQKLREKLEQEPNRLDGWLLLARSYMAMNKYNDAVAAYNHAYSLAPDNTAALLGYADALTMQNNGRITPQADKMIARALELNPSDPTALWLSAMAHEAKDDFRTAVTYWQRLLPLMSGQPQQLQEVKARFTQALSRLTPEQQKAFAASIQAMPQHPQVSSGAAGASIKVTVNLADKFKNSVQDTDTVFIFARAVQGPPQPVAVQRLQVKDLPATITLDDTKAIMPTNKLSSHKQVYVGAKISRSGSATSSSGDLQGRSGAIEVGKADQQVTITIDQEVL